MEQAFLAGLRVLDLTRLYPGPFCTLYLADLGADVIKIEDREVGDYARAAPVPVPGGLSTFFRNINRNKRSLCLDLRRPEGQAILQNAVRQADILVEGFRPGVATRLGVDYATLSAINPGLVYASITGYGQDGPYRDKAGHDVNYLSYAGITDQVGEAGRPPALLNFQIADVAGGALHALIGILAALYRRRQTGAGCYVDVAMLDCAAAMNLMPLAGLVDRGQVPPRGQDVLSGGAAHYGIYVTRDGRYLSLAAGEPKFWANFCRAAGRADLAGEHAAQGPAAERIRREIQALLSSEDREHWLERLRDVDCCLSPVNTVAEALQDPQLQARGMIYDSDGCAQWSFPIKLDGTRPVERRRAPAHGADSRSVLRDFGLQDTEIDALERAGIVGPRTAAA